MLHRTPPGGLREGDPMTPDDRPDDPEGMTMSAMHERVLRNFMSADGRLTSIPTKQS